MELLDQYTINVNHGPLHEDASALPADPPERHQAKLIAYYLPQFHAIPENDAWWGAGFTEWTNVTKAVPRYLGHYQPRLPADLGYYDLRSPEVIRAQAQLAARAGIYGFCIHDYWFGGRRILETPIEAILADPSIDLRFCVNWANENWTRVWDGHARDVLLQQAHSEEDDLRYADHLLRYAADPRYLRIDGRPIVMVYRPNIMPDAAATFQRWRKRFLEAGEAEPFVIMPQAFENEDPRIFGMDAAAGFPPHRSGFGTVRADSPLPDVRPLLRMFDLDFRTGVRSYEAMIAYDRSMRGGDYRFFPGVCPSWDNEARRPGAGIGFAGTSPKLYGEWLFDAAQYSVAHNPPGEAFVFINAWNEWAEGAYLEPDRHYGYAWLTETRRAVDAVNEDRDYVSPATATSAHAPALSKMNMWRNRLSRRARDLRRKLRPVSQIGG